MQKEFRKMIDYLREMEGLSWGQICTLSGLEIRGSMNGPEMIQVAYRRKATERTFKAIQSLYADRKSSKSPVPVQKEKKANLSKETRLINFLRQNPGSSQIDIRKKLDGVGPTTLQRLIEAKRIVTRKRTDLKGHPIHHFLAEEVPLWAPEGSSEPEQGGDAAPKAEEPEKGSQAPPSGDPEEKQPLSWDWIREELMRVADQILELAERVEFPAGTPKSIRKEVREIYCARHDRLIRFIEEELDA